MKHKNNKLIFIGILLLFSLIVSFCFDRSLIEIISFLRNTILDNFFLFITFVSAEIIICFLWRENKRRWILPLWVTLGATAVLSFVLKILVRRPRPFQIGAVDLISNLQEASYSIWNFSFPSFQSMLVFSAIPILNVQFPKLKKFWIAFAILVGFSRIYFGVHFFSDVITGGLIGYLIGMGIVRLEKKKEFGKKVYKKIFRK